MTTAVFALLVAARVYHVSPAGNDAANGLSARTAFRTLGRAARALRPGDTCVVHAGTYRETVSLPADGAPGAPITFRAEGAATLSGSDPIQGWSPVGSGTFQASLPAPFRETLQSDQFFEGGRAMELLRWPRNTGTLAAPTDAKVVEARDAGGDRIEFRVSPTWDEPDGRWAGAKVWVNLSHLGRNWGQDGQAQTGTVVATDRAKGTITVAGIDKRSWEGGNYNPDQPWGIGPGTELHLFDPTPRGIAATGGPASALKPGDWWWNSETKRVYIRPRSGQAKGIESRRRSFAFDLSGRKDVVIDGFRLFATSITTDRDAATRWNSVAPAERITLRNLKGRYLTHFTDHTGQFQMQWLQKSGIRLSGTGHLLERCTFEDVAGPAVTVIGRRNRVLGNVIRGANYSVSEAGCIDTGRAFDPGPTISVDHEIGYNTIEDSPQQGINLRGLVNSDPRRPGLARVHHNVVRRVMTRAYDSAAIDQYGTDGQMVRIDHNLISDMPQSLQIGIYVDFGFGYLIDHNVLWNVERPIQVNHNDAKRPGRVRVEWNTALSTIFNPPHGRLPGVLNGAGKTNPASTALSNLSSAGVQFGPDAEARGNVTADESMFIDPKSGDLRPRQRIEAGAIPFGEPMIRAGAAAYPSARDRR